MKKKAVFLGDRRDVDKLLQIMDIFCLTSVSEGTPLTLIEAMASEKPIVATRVGGVPEVVIDRSNGYLKEPGDSHGLTEAIMDLLENSEVRKQMGEKGYKRAFEFFHVNIMAKNYQNLYTNIVENKT